MRSKKFVEMLQDFHLIVLQDSPFIEASFVRFIRTKARPNGDIVFPTNLCHDSSVAALDNKIWS